MRLSMRPQQRFREDSPASMSSRPLSPMIAVGKRAHERSAVSCWERVGGLGWPPRWICLVVLGKLDTRLSRNESQRKSSAVLCGLVVDCCGMARRQRRRRAEYLMRLRNFERAPGHGPLVRAVQLWRRYPHADAADATRPYRLLPPASHSIAITFAASDSCAPPGYKDDARVDRPYVTHHRSRSDATQPAMS
jgi:hypothetical protein